MIVGGYTLDLYCKYASTSYGITAGKRHKQWNDKGSISLYGQNKSECVKQAKSHGWKFIDDDVICKKCLAEGLK